MGKIKVQGNINGLGVYGFTNDTGKVLYVGSGMMNDRKQNHEYHLKKGNYKYNNKNILQEEYEKDDLTFKVLHFSINNSTYVNGTNEERQEIQESLEVLEQFYYNLYRDTCCNQIKKIHKWTTSPNKISTEKRRRANIGENNPHNTKLTKQDVKEIKLKLKKGVKQVNLVEQYNVSPTHIWNIANGIRWNSVQV
ncbi:endonuclease [Clostridium botulinum]|nr:endonuclease [Clostridium botulinum]